MERNGKSTKNFESEITTKQLERISYSVITGFFKEKDDVWQHADKLLKQIQTGELELIDPAPIEVKKPLPRSYWDI